MIESLHGARETVNFRVSTIARLYRNDEPEDYPAHWHLPGEIIAPLINTYQVTVAGQTLILQPGDVLIIGSSELHSIQAPPEGVRYILNVDYDLFEHIPDLTVLVALLQPYYLVSRASSPQLARQLVGLLQNIEEEYASSQIYRDGEICSLLIHFFALVGRHSANLEKLQSLAPQKEYTDRFVYICDYINSHCTENLPLDQISEQAGFSKYYFSRLFREATGTTCHNYVTRRRILYAQNLLADSSVAVTEVALRSGFNSLATFNRIFKRQLGCTPSEYRQLHSSISQPCQGTSD